MINSRTIVNIDQCLLKIHVGALCEDDPDGGEDLCQVLAHRLGEVLHKSRDTL